MNCRTLLLALLMSAASVFSIPVTNRATITYVTRAEMYLILSNFYGGTGIVTYAAVAAGDKASSNYTYNMVLLTRFDMSTADTSLSNQILAVSNTLSGLIGAQAAGTANFALVALFSSNSYFASNAYYAVTSVWSDTAGYAQAVDLAGISNWFMSRHGDTVTGNYSIIGRSVGPFRIESLYEEMWEGFSDDPNQRIRAYMDGDKVGWVLDLATGHNLGIINTDFLEDIRPVASFIQVPYPDGPNPSDDNLTWVRYAYPPQADPAPGVSFTNFGATVGYVLDLLANASSVVTNPLHIGTPTTGDGSVRLYDASNNRYMRLEADGAKLRVYDDVDSDLLATITFDFGSYRSPVIRGIVTDAGDDRSAASVQFVTARIAERSNLDMQSASNTFLFKGGDQVVGNLCVATNDPNSGLLRLYEAVGTSYIDSVSFGSGAGGRWIGAGGPIFLGTTATYTGDVVNGFWYNGGASNWIARKLTHTNGLWYTAFEFSEYPDGLVSPTILGNYSVSGVGYDIGTYPFHAASSLTENGPVTLHTIVVTNRYVTDLEVAMMVMSASNHAAYADRAGWSWQTEYATNAGEATWAWQSEYALNAGTSAVAGWLNTWGDGPPIETIYANDITNAAMASAKQYADNVTNAALASAKQYTDNLIPQLNPAPFYTTYDWINMHGSPGVVSGGELSMPAVNTITVSNGLGILNTSYLDYSTSGVRNTQWFTWTNSTFKLPVGTSVYLYMNYSPTQPYITMQTNLVGSTLLRWELHRLYLEHSGGVPYGIKSYLQLGHLSYREHERLKEKYGISYGSGLQVSIPNNYVESTPGSVYYGTTRREVPAFNSLASDFDTYYRTNGVWVEVATQKLDTVRFSTNGTELATSTNGAYLVMWMYGSANNKASVQYGEAQYQSLADARLATRPQPPPYFYEFCLYMGKVIVTNNSQTGYADLQYAWDVTVSSSGDGGQSGGGVGTTSVFAYAAGTSDFAYVAGSSLSETNYVEIGGDTMLGDLSLLEKEVMKLTYKPYLTTLTGWETDYVGQKDFPSGTDFIDIKAGIFNLALHSNGSVSAWGNNYENCVSDCPTESNIVAIAAAYAHGLVLTTNGSLHAWGYNFNGQTNCPAGTNFIMISAGFFHNLAMMDDRSITGWGGGDTYGESYAPPGTNYIALACGSGVSVGLKEDGSLYSWGAPYFGKTNSPPGTNYVAIAAGDRVSAALRDDGSLVLWGQNTWGQTNCPAGSYTAIAIGDKHCTALRSNGEVISWGQNNAGQCNYPPGTNFTAVAAGAYTSVATMRYPQILTNPVVSSAVDSNYYALRYYVDNGVLGLSNYIESATNAINAKFVKKTGDTMSGSLAITNDRSNSVYFEVRNESAPPVIQSRYIRAYSDYINFYSSDSPLYRCYISNNYDTFDMEFRAHSGYRRISIADPVSNYNAATKIYVDNGVLGLSNYVDEGLATTTDFARASTTNDYAQKSAVAATFAGTTDFARASLTNDFAQKSAVAAAFAGTNDFLLKSGGIMAGAIDMGSGGSYNDINVASSIGVVIPGAGALEVTLLANASSNLVATNAYAGGGYAQVLAATPTSPNALATKEYVDYLNTGIYASRWFTNQYSYAHAGGVALTTYVHFTNWMNSAELYGDIDSTLTGIYIRVAGTYQVSGHVGVRGNTANNYSHQRMVVYVNSSESPRFRTHATVYDNVADGYYHAMPIGGVITLASNDFISVRLSGSTADAIFPTDGNITVRKIR